jgi:hypothetical protein
MSLGRNLSKRIIGLLRGRGAPNVKPPVLTNYESTCSPWGRSSAAAIRLPSKVVMLRKPLSRESFTADEKLASIYTKAFFQAWINSRPCLPLSEFIDRFKAGDQTILAAVDREHSALPGSTLTPERLRVPRHVA